MTQVINLDDAQGKPIPSMRGDQIRLTEEGHIDEGAFQRAVAIARELARLGHWDGQSEIRIADAYAIYNSLDHFVTVAFEEEYQALVVRRANPPEPAQPTPAPKSNMDHLASAVGSYRDARDAYFAADMDAIELEQIDTLRRAYDDAAHSVAFHADMFIDSKIAAMAAAPELFQIPPHDQAPNLIPSHQDALRQMFDEPELPAGGYDLCRDCGERRALDEFARCASCAAAKDEEIPSDFGDCRDCGGTMPLDSNGRCYSCAYQRCIKDDPECPNPGWPFPCPKCNYCRQNPDELAQSDENQDDVSSDWLTAATELHLQSQVSDSRDYFMDDDDYDYEDGYDEWDFETSHSRWIVKAKNGHISIGVGVLTRYPGEDWGEASGWEEEHYNLNRYSDEFKQRIIAFVKDKAPGHYDVPSHLDEDDEDESDSDASTDATTVDEIEF